MKKLLMLSGIYALFQYISHSFMAIGSHIIIPLKVDLVCEGRENVPHNGPVLIVAHHFHHFYDGCIFLAIIPRRLHIFVALDWIQKHWARHLMEFACTLLGWPVVLRSERLNQAGARDTQQIPSAYAPTEVRHYLVHASTTAVKQLRNGEMLVIFPEAYPNIDPVYTPKADNDAFLPFKPGFARIAERAERDGQTRVAIVPAGLSYVYAGRWQVKLRFGAPLFLQDFTATDQLVHELEKQVHMLSGHALVGSESA